ncbi:MAG: DUF2723 domain-containing protein [Elusimicrobiota bacterium]
MKYLLTASIFIITFSAYLYTTVPSLTEDDSGELAGVGATLGIGHSPGYPFYSLAGKITNTVIPLGNPVYRINFMNGMFISAAASIIFLAVAALTLNPAAAFVSALVFGFSKPVWSMANVTEVYGIAAFISCLLCLLIAVKPSIPRFMLAAFLFGIGMTAHYTIGLFILGLIWWMYVSYKRENNLRRMKYDLPKALLFGLAGFSMVVFIYIRAQNDPVFGWEDPKTLKRFWQVIARLRYGTAALAQGGLPPFSPEIILKKIAFYFSSLNSSLTAAGVILFIIGLVSFVKDRIRGWAYLLLLLASGPGFLLMANVGLDRTSMELLERFFFLSQAIVAIILGAGLSKLPRKVIPAVMLLPAFIFSANLGPLNHRNEFMFRDYGRNILRTVPTGAVLFSDRADEMEFTVGYLMFVEKLRPDIFFVDCNAAITRSIYGDDYYRVWGKPRLRIRTIVEGNIIASSGRPVYYATFEPGMIDIPRYQEGLIYRAKPAKPARPPFPCAEIYAIRSAGGMSARSESLLMSHYFLLGKYCLATGNPDTGERFFAGIEAYDTGGRWSSNIGFQFHEAGYIDHAVKQYERSAAKGLADSNVYTNLGVIYKNRGGKEASLKMYGKALELDPDNYQAHFNLSVLYWEEGRWDKVVSELEEALRIKPDSREAANYLNMARQRIK